MPDPSHARGRGRLRRAGRAGLSAADELAAALLSPEEALAMDVHGGTQAAVLVPLYVGAAGAMHAVFTRRRHDLSRHAGEISFPGGRREEGEELLDTALREAHEEIGLPPDAVRVLGCLPPTTTFVTNYAIYPYVGLIDPGFAWVVQRAEVDEVLELRLDELAAGAGERRLLRRGIPFRTPAYETGGHVVWGATARILGELLARTSRSAR